MAFGILLPLYVVLCRRTPRARRIGTCHTACRKETKAMYKLIFCLLLAVTPVAFTQENTARPTTKELMAKDKVFFVTSDTFYVKKEELEKGLLNREEFARWGLQVTKNEENADAVLFVRRAPFQTFFPYTITDRATGIVIMGGEPNSLGGTVPGKIAGDIVEKLRPIYEPKQNAANPAATP